MITPQDYSVQIYKEDNGYIAISPEWPRLSVFAHTQQDAIREMQVVLEMAIEIAAEDNEALPTPAKAEPASPVSGRASR